MDSFVNLLVEEMFNDFEAGHTFTVVKALDPSDASWTPVFTDVGGGNYVVSFTPATVGSWHLAWTSNQTGVNYVETFTILPAPLPTVITEGTLSAGNATRGDLRRGVANRLRDLREFMLTANGSKATATDTANFREDKDFFKGSMAYFRGGGNNQSFRYITGSDYNSSTITLAEDLPATTAAGDLGEIYMSYTILEYNRAIDNVLRSLHPMRKKLRVEEMATAWNMSSPYGTYPAAFTHVAAVEYKDGSGLWHRVRTAMYPGGNGVWIEQGNPEFAIGGKSSWNADGNLLRIVGYERYPLPVLDTDLIDVDWEWMVERTVAEMRLSNATENNLAFGQYRQNRADALLGAMVSPELPNTVQVR